MLISIVAVVGIAWYYKLGPFDRGDVSISLGYVLSDGTEVELTGHTSMILYMDPQTFRWYSDSSKTQQITGIWGEVWVEPVTDLNDDTIDISWSGTITIPTINPTTGDITGYENYSWPGSGDAVVPPNVDSEIEASKYTLNLTSDIMGTIPAHTYPYTWTYSITASATDPTIGTRTASTTAEGTLSAYWTPDGTLTVVASVTTGYLQLVR